MSSWKHSYIFMGYRKETSDWNGLIFPLTKVLSTNKFWVHVNVRILTYKVISLPIDIPLSHIFDLSFAAWKNLFITWTNFEGHIIKLDRLHFWTKMSIVEYKCESSNIKMAPAEYKCESLNIKMSTVEHKYELLCESIIALYYCWILNSLFLNVFKSMFWIHESQSLNFATNKQP